MLSAAAPSMQHKWSRCQLPSEAVRTQVLAIVGRDGRIGGTPTKCGIRPCRHDQARLVHISPCKPKVDDMPGPCSPVERSGVCTHRVASLGGLALDSQSRTSQHEAGPLVTMPPGEQRHPQQGLTFVHCGMTGRDREVCRLDVAVDETQLVHACNRRQLSIQGLDSWLQSPETRLRRETRQRPESVQ